MAIDVSQFTIPIKTAVKARDVRDNIANGIDAIASEVNNYEEQLSSDNDQFKEDATKQQNDYESNVNGQWNTYKQGMNVDESTRQQNEDTRINDETIRKANEATRQVVYNDFRNYVNSASNIGRVPYLFDGGDYGDTAQTGLTLNGGDY